MLRIHAQVEERSFRLDREVEMTTQIQRWELANGEYKPDGSSEFMEGKCSPIAIVEDRNLFFREEDVSSIIL